MKKLFFVLLTSLMLVGCATQMPVAACVDFPQDSAKYRILGRVTLEAKRLYPECDDVVNIMVDATGTKSLIGGITYKNYVMTGIAIDYVEVKQ